MTFDDVRALGSELPQAVAEIADERLHGIHGLLLDNDVAGALHAGAETLEAPVEMMNAANKTLGGAVPATDVEVEVRDDDRGAPALIKAFEDRLERSRPGPASSAWRCGRTSATISAS